MSVTQFKVGVPYKYPLPDGMTLVQIATECELNKSTVSRILRGESDGTEGFKRVMEALKKGAPEGGQPVVSALVEQPGTTLVDQRFSRGQQLFQAMLEATAEDREFTVLVGPSGAGKTHCVRLFADKWPEVIVMQAQQRMSVGDLLNGLCKLFDCAATGTNYQRLDRVLLACQGRFLIVDEADLFVYDRSNGQIIRFLDIFRQLHDRGCTVVLVGLPLLFDGIIRSGETYVYRRIGYFRKIGPPTQEELADFWRALTPGMPDAHAKAGLVAHQAQRFGLYGYLQKLAGRLKKMDGDVEAAISFLFRPEGG